MEGKMHLEGVFKFDSDILSTIFKKPKFAFVFIESAVFLPMQLESKKVHSELTKEELLMVIKYMNNRIKHSFDKRSTCSSYSCSKFSISFTYLCVLPLLPVHSSNNHFGSSVFTPGYYVLALFILHLDLVY